MYVFIIYNYELGNKFWSIMQRDYIMIDLFKKLQVNSLDYYRFCGIQISATKILFWSQYHNDKYQVICIYSDGI